MRTESHITSIIEGERKAPLAKRLLRAMSGAYRIASRLHRYGYSSILPKAHLPLPVISVGNIVAGGSGKTPFTHYLATQLAQKKVAILSRGYRRKSKQTLLVTGEMSCEECGDEPKLLKQKLPGCFVIVGKDRVHSGHLASTLGAELILLDDGLQHRRLHRDVEIILIDAGNLLGGGHFLPYGYLRDDPEILSSADLIVLTRVKGEDHFEEAEKELRKWTQSPLTVMEAIYENRDAISGKTIGAFCAIARPRRFLETLESFGCQIATSLFKPDHTPFSLDELQRLAQSSEMEALVCTEKDAIKWSSLPKLPLPIIPLKMSLRPRFGVADLEKLIHGVQI